MYYNKDPKRGHKFDYRPADGSSKEDFEDPGDFAQQYTKQELRAGALNPKS